MLHLFYMPQGELKLLINGQPVFGNCIVVDSDVFHTLPFNTELLFFFCIDSTTTIADQLRNIYLKGNVFSIIPIEKTNLSFTNFYSTMTYSIYAQFKADLFKQLGIKRYDNAQMDERIKILIREINTFSHIESTITQISKKLFLSESRLSHLFKEETGVTLKSYIVLAKLKKAYKLLSQGKNITEAAIESGFFSASHLADTNRKMMGMNISAAIKDSRFLEA